MMLEGSTGFDGLRCRVKSAKLKGAAALLSQLSSSVAEGLWVIIRLIQAA